MSSRHRSKRKESRDQSWSDWTWNDEHQCDVRCRSNNAGKLEWDYRWPAETVQASDYNNQSTPRYSPSYAPTSPQVKESRKTSNSPAESYTHEPGDESVGELSRVTTLSDHVVYSDKGKQPVNSTTSSWQSSASSTSHTPQALTYPQYGQGNQYPNLSHNPTTQSYSQGQAQLNYIQNGNQTTSAEPFAGQYDEASYKGTNFDRNFTTNTHSSYNTSNYGYGATSSHWTTDPSHIVGNKKLEPLDSDFKLHYSKEFKFMRVFKMVWHETRGENNTFGTDTILGMFKQPVNASIRRFVILKADKGHCLCLPILTYNKQGTTKPGLNVSTHGIIYTGKHTPKLLPKEQELSKPSVRMIPNSEKDMLDPASRINYAKIYTVEHNVKCVFIGKIDESHRDRVVEEYNKALQI